MPRPNDPTLPEFYGYRFELGGRPFYVGLGRAKRASDRLRYVSLSHESTGLAQGIHFP